MGSAKSIEELRQALDAVFGNETVPGLGPYDASDMLDDALDELERLRAAARRAIEVLESGADGAVSDTVWVGPGETLVDLLENALGVAR